MEEPIQDPDSQEPIRQPDQGGPPQHDADGITNELRKFLSDLSREKPPAEEEIPSETEDASSPSPSIPPMPEAPSSPLSHDVTDQIEEEGPLRSEFVPPKPFEEAPLPEASSLMDDVGDGESPLGSQIMKESETGSDNDFWSGNVLGWSS